MTNLELSLVVGLAVSDTVLGVLAYKFVKALQTSYAKTTSVALAILERLEGTEADLTSGLQNLLDAHIEQMQVLQAGQHAALEQLQVNHASIANQLSEAQRPIVELNEKRAAAVAGGHAVCTKCDSVVARYEMTNKGPVCLNCVNEASRKAAV